MKKDHYVVVDLDGTVAPNDKDGNLLPPYPDARHFMRKIQSEGGKIVVHTGRTHSGLGDKGMTHRQLSDYLKKHDIPFDYIYKADKPMATAYVDDRAVPYTGSWQAVFDRVKNMIRDEKEKK